MLLIRRFYERVSIRFISRSLYPPYQHNISVSSSRTMRHAYCCWILHIYKWRFYVLLLSNGLVQICWFRFRFVGTVHGCFTVSIWIYYFSIWRFPLFWIRYWVILLFYLILVETWSIIRFFCIKRIIFVLILLSLSLNLLLITLVQFFSPFLFAKDDFRFEEVVDDGVMEILGLEIGNNKTDNIVNGVDIDKSFRKVLNFSRFLLEVEVPNIGIVFSWR